TKNQTNKLFLVNNTMVNDRRAGALFLHTSSTPHAVVRAINNLLVGARLVSNTQWELSHNLETQEPAFVNRRAFDYHLTKRSPAIGAGIDPGTADEVSLMPSAQYAHNAAEIARLNTGRIDVGALEYALTR